MPTAAPIFRPFEVRPDVSHTRLNAIDRSVFYGHRWRKLRAAFLVQNPLCACGCGRPATVVDHVVPHNGNLSLAFAWDNLQALTKSCHDRKTAALDGGFGNPLKRRVHA